jgi:NTP pyrophosphatase (non-canonical NTP hydrolase)
LGIEEQRMDFDEYQDTAAFTDQFRDKRDESDLMIPLLGLAGETGTLLAEFKKKIRDRESYEGFNEKAEEELGDILWYVSNIASRLDLSLSTIASKNLQKTSERWPTGTESREVFASLDETYPPSERLPQIIRIRVVEHDERGKRARMLLEDGSPLGDPLTDNAYEDDGYRFHDVLHFGHYAVLGWSPVIRGLLKRKRKSVQQTDVVEDGARSMILEELIVAYIYSKAREMKHYSGVRYVDSDLIATIKRLVAHLEVNKRRGKDWEEAILKGYAAFRHIVEVREATFELDMKAREIRVVK